MGWYNLVKHFKKYPADKAPLTVLDLFSGTGGFSLGLERAGLKTIAFCEIENYPTRVLNKNWPEVPVFPDVKELNGHEFKGSVDIVCGGFPCQDISFMGSGAGITGDRSGLWGEMCRVIRDVRPKYAIMENVSALLNRGLGDVLRDLAAIGYDAEWYCIPASALGAPHRRDRIWIVAYPADEQRWSGTDQGGDGGGIRVAAENRGCGFAETGSNENVANSTGVRLQGVRASRNEKPSPLVGKRLFNSYRNGGRKREWTSEPELGRVAYGVSNGVDRIKALGNAVVPQIPEMIGLAILRLEEDKKRAGRLKPALL